MYICMYMNYYTNVTSNGLESSILKSGKDCLSRYAKLDNNL